MEADVLGLVGQVVPIYADTVAAEQAGATRQEVSFGASGFEHHAGVQAQFAGQHGQFVDQGDVDVALGVFDDLGSFGDPDAGGLVSAGGDDFGVESVAKIGGFLRRAGGDLFYGWEALLFISWVYAFGGVADEELPFRWFVFWSFRSDEAMRFHRRKRKSGRYRVRGRGRSLLRCSRDRQCSRR